MAESRLDVVVQGRDELSPELRRIESSVIRAVGAISASLAAIKIGAAPTLAAAEFEKEIANVAKTTNFVSKALTGGIGELDQLSEALLDISLRINVTAVDLAKIASAAGQLGFSDKFGVEGVITFTDAVARMASVLDISAEKAATDLGKIINIFKTPIKEIEKAISIVNEVSNKTTARGEELLDVIKRIGDAAGSLTLQQSAALSATGIDFGLSPEVVGTGFSKAFSAMREDAEKFAKVVKGIATSTGKVFDGSAKNFIKVVEENGIEALKAYLKGLRKLDAQSQQQAIVKLVGGGRVGALFNKLVQDASDSVLNNALKAAEEGSLGLSALKEQATVLFTLSAQAKILQNSLFKLGVNSAGVFLPQLTQLTAQLSAALQTPEVKSFVNSVVSGFVGLATEIGAVIKYVASLNINWENFVRVLKVFLEIKLIQLFAGLIGSVSLFGVSLKSISKEANTAAAATGKLGAAIAAEAAAEQANLKSRVAGYLARETGIGRVIEKVKALRAEEALAAKAKEAVGPAIDLAGAAARASNNASFATTPDLVNVADTAKTLEARKAALIAAEKGAADSIVAINAAKNASIQKKTTESEARRNAIEAEYQAKRLEIAATGTATGLKAARADRASQLAEEEAALAKRLAAVERFYARKAALDSASRAPVIDKARTAVTTGTAAAAAAIAASAASQAIAANLAAESAAAAAAANSAKETADKLSKGAGVGTRALSILGGAVTLFASLAKAASKIILSGFVWITLLYSLADATGLLEKLGPTFDKFTQFLGFNSKASLEAKIKLDEAKQAAKKATAEFEKTLEAYKALTDGNLGRVDISKIDALLQQARLSADPAQQTAAIAALASNLQAVIDVNSRAQAELNASGNAAVQEKIAQLEALDKKLAELGVKINNALQFKNADTSASEITAAFDGEVKALTDAIKDAKKELNDLFTKQATSSAVLGRTSEDLLIFKERLGSLFTPESSKAILEYLTPIYELQKQLDLLKTKKADAQKAFGEGGAIEAKKVLDDQTLQMGKLGEELLAAKVKLTEFINKYGELNGVGAGVVTALRTGVNRVLDLATKDLGTVLSALPQIEDKNKTGKNNPNPTPAKTGTDSVSFKGESKRDKELKLATARLALERTILEAGNKLRDEFDKQTLEKNQDFYDKGLVSLKYFYEQKEKIQIAAINADINTKALDLASTEKELANIRAKKDKVGELKFLADQARIKGEIDVLNARKDGIQKEVDRDEQKAKDEFKKQVLDQQNSLFADGILPSDITATFQSNLDGLLLQYNSFLLKLRGAKKGGLADATLLKFNIDAVKAAIAPVSDLINLELDKLSRLQTRVSAAQTRGSLTAIEADALQTAAIKQRLPVLEQLLETQEKALAALGKEAAGTLAYQQLSANIDKTRLSLEQLNLEQNKTAKAINASITTSVNDAINNILDKTATLSQGIQQALNGIKKTIQKTLVEDLTSKAGRALGLDGEGGGGIGGFVTKLLGGPQAAKRGESLAKPLYVQDVNAQTKPKDPAGTDPIEEPKSEIGSIFDDVTNKVKETLSSLGKGLSETFDSVVNSLSSAFSGLFGSSGGGGGIGGFLASIFHDGGIVGGPAPARFVSPELFKNARRYHSGGVAGLKPGEVPAILQKGEQVLTKNQQNIAAAGAGASKPSDVTLSLHPEMLNYTMRDWFERELSRINSVR